MKKITRILLLCLIILPANLAYESTDYLEEFNNEGEVCKTADVFNYQQLEPKWWKNSYYVSTVPVFYQCCKDEKCIALVVDIQEGELLYDRSVKELIDLNFIKVELADGNLSETHFVNEGLNSCFFHGKKELTQESLNLAADAAETIATVRDTKQAKQVVTVIRTARALEIFSPFSIADFSLSVACTFNDKKLEKAIETLATCDLYLKNIKNNFARTGYVSELNGCYDKARIGLGDYLDSDIAKTKHYVDKTANFFSDLFSDPVTMLEEGEITDTEFELAKSVYNKISDKKLLLHNPRKEIIFEKYVERVIQKQTNFTSKNNKVQEEINQLKKQTPWTIEIFLSDVFANPNYNISNGTINLKKADEIMDNCRSLYYINKFNSAIKCIDEAERNLNLAKPIIERELETERSFDKRWILWFILICISSIAAIFGIIYVVRKIIENQY